MKPPPFHVPPDVLFRRMLELPRPSKAIPYRIRGAEDVELTVRAITWHDEMAAHDSPDSAALLHYIQRSLWTNDGQAFGSIEQVGALDEYEVEHLGYHVFNALLEVSPSYCRTRWDQWVEQLKLGASAPINFTTAMVLADCSDEGGSTIRPRPERYWGCRPFELTDGQRMVAHASLMVVNKMREEHREQQRAAEPKRPGRR